MLHRDKNKTRLYQTNTLLLGSGDIWDGEILKLLKVQAQAVHFSLTLRRREKTNKDLELSSCK